jgi:hypothetical protein
MSAFDLLLLLAKIPENSCWFCKLLKIDRYIIQIKYHPPSKINLSLIQGTYQLLIIYHAGDNDERYSGG